MVGVKGRVLLVNPSQHFKQRGRSVVVNRTDPPVGLLNIASFLEERGYACEIINAVLEENASQAIFDSIKSSLPLFVGFGVFVGPFLRNARGFSEEIKKAFPSLPVVWGGVQPSISPGQVLGLDCVDFVIRYEGEHTAFELAEALRSGEGFDGVRGLSFKKGNSVVHNPGRLLENNLDNFPVPKWELFGEQCNREQKPYYFRINTSKGCPFKCTFCYNNQVDKSVWGGTPLWRPRSAEHVIKEIEHIHKLTGATVFTIGDDNFMINRGRAKKIFRHLRNRDFYLEQCVAHFNLLNDEMIEEMAGVVQSMLYSVEVSTQKMQKIVKKGLDVSRIPAVNRALFDVGINVVIDFIAGIPTESDEDLRANVKFMLDLKEMNPYSRAMCYLFLPLPDTPLLYSTEKMFGVEISQKLGDLEGAAIDTGLATRKLRPWLSEEQLKFLSDYCLVFCDAFVMKNNKLSDKALAVLGGSERLQDIFYGVKRVRCPPPDSVDSYRPYVLDRVLRGESIDLRRDLQKHCKSIYRIGGAGRSK